MKTGISTRARLCIREVARELVEDMELEAERDLNAVAPSTASFPPPHPPQLASHRRRALSLSRCGQGHALYRHGRRRCRPLI